MKRVGAAEEIANAIVWLMSDEASYVTSTILDVSGGVNACHTSVLVLTFASHCRTCFANVRTKGTLANYLI